VVLFICQELKTSLYARVPINAGGLKDMAGGAFSVVVCGEHLMFRKRNIRCMHKQGRMVRKIQEDTACLSAAISADGNRCHNRQGSFVLFFLADKEEGSVDESKKENR